MHRPERSERTRLLSGRSSSRRPGIWENPQERESWAGEAGGAGVTSRNFRKLEAFLGEQGVDLENRAFELELNNHGWRVARERSTRQGVQLEIECLVECDEQLPPPSRSRRIPAIPTGMWP